MPRSDNWKEEAQGREPWPAAAGRNADPVVLAPLTADVEAWPATSPVWRKEFEFSGVLDLVPENREQVMEFVGCHCPDEGDQIDILVAVQEALANAALHGCHDDPEKLIHCVVTADTNEITIAVRDPGPGFNLEKADPDKYQATKLRHGRGICLMRGMMTEVSYARGGAEVRLRKRINSH